MKYTLPLILLMGCTPIPTSPERCVAVAATAANKTPYDDFEYRLAWRQNYERAFEACK